MLNVHEAQITTATVQIRTLTVSGKQVTLAVFRQLINDSWEDADCFPRGEPWGTVNYHPDSACKDRDPHLHVVWQLGDELRRAYLRKPFYRDLLVDGDADWLTVAVYSGWRPKNLVRRETGGYPYYRTLIREQFDSGTLDIDPPRVVDRFLDAVTAVKARDNDWSRRDYQRAHEALTEAALPLMENGWTFERWTQEIEEQIIERLQVRARIDANWKVACDLPQLFIAV